jgi:hypothetical protein
MFRYYDLDIGRFISEDLIGLWGGENLYAYAPKLACKAKTHRLDGGTMVPVILGLLRGHM